MTDPLRGPGEPCIYYNRPGHTLDQRPAALTYLRNDPAAWPLCPPCALAAGRQVDATPPAEPRPEWKHSGLCIYCQHGPHCPRCVAADSPHYATGADWPGPVCAVCVEEIKRAEIAADPYYSGDYYAMFGDDE